MPDLRITQLTEETVAANDEPLAIVDDPTGSPVTKKITVNNLLRKEATLIVARSGYGGADYLCDGTDDDVQINQAIYDLLNYNGGSGRVILREGTFNLDTAIKIPRSNIVLEGQGSSTILKLQDNADVNSIEISHGTVVTSTGISFQNVNPDTITRAAGSFVTQGFAAGGKITITGSTSNNGTYTIASVSALVLTLIATDALTNESAGASVTITPTTSVDCVVRNLMIDGNATNQASNGVGIFLYDKTSRPLIENCRITNTLAANISDSSTSVSYPVVRNNILDPTASGGGWANIDGIGGGATIQGNIIDGGDNGNIIWYSLPPNILRILDNELLNAGINTLDGSDGDTTALVSNNYITNPGEQVINVGGPSEFYNNKIIITNNPTGILIDIANVDAVVRNNFIKVTTGNTNPVTVIKVNGDSVCGDNVMHFVTAEAHKAITAIQSEFSLTGNYIRMETIVAGSIGIEVNGATDFVLSGSFIYGCALAIDAAGSRDGIITANDIWFNTNAIDVTESDMSTITGNTFEDADSCVFSTSDNYTEWITVTGNSFLNTGDTILLRSMRYCTVTGNAFHGTGTTASVLFKTVSGTNYSKYNTVTGNTLASGSGSYQIREDSTNDGPNIVIGNVALGASLAQISTQNANTDVSHNITS